MANVKITALPAITTIAADDVLPIVDVSADITNKITLTQVQEATGVNLKAPLASPTFTGTVTIPAGAVIPNIAPAADFTLTQNAVVPITSVNAGAVANTLYLKEGNVGIGTVSPGAKLEVREDAGEICVSTIQGSGANAKFTMLLAGLTNSPYTDIQMYAPTGDGSEYLRFNIKNSSGTIFPDALTLNRLGNVGIGMIPNVQFELSGSIGQKATGTAWSNPSDERLKDVLGLADLQRCYDDVKALPLKRYRLKDSCFTAEHAKDRTLIGWVANDVKKVIPKAVDVKPFSMVAVDDGTEIIEEQETIDEEVLETSTEIVEIEDKFVQRNVTKARIEKRLQFDEFSLYDESGKQLIDEKGNLVNYRKPRMIQIVKPKKRQDVIEDCLTLNADQIYVAMFGCVQMLIKKVEALEARAIK